MPVSYVAEMARLEAVIEDAELRIERQRELIEKMGARGLAVDDACRTLDTMLAVLESLQSKRAALLRLWKSRYH